MSTEKASISPYDKLVLKTTVNNTTDRNIEEEFGCTDTDPSYLLNDEPLGEGVCLTKMTKRSIGAKRTEAFVRKLSGFALKAGENIIYSNWARYEGGTINVYRDALSEAKIAKHFQTCQHLGDNMQLEDTPDFCGYVMVYFKKNGTEKPSCSKKKSILQKAGLVLSCNAMDQVFVPHDEEDKYRG